MWLLPSVSNEEICFPSRNTLPPCWTCQPHYWARLTPGIFLLPSCIILPRKSHPGTAHVTQSFNEQSLVGPSSGSSTFLPILYYSPHKPLLQLSLPASSRLHTSPPPPSQTHLYLSVCFYYPCVTFLWASYSTLSLVMFPPSAEHSHVCLLSPSSLSPHSPWSKDAFLYHVRLLPRAHVDWSVGVCGVWITYLGPSIKFSWMNKSIANVFISNKIHCICMEFEPYIRLWFKTIHKY